MNVQRRNDSLIYCLSSGPTIPEWLGERARRNLSKRDENIRRRIELIQDFQMPSSSSKLVQSADGRYIMVAGTYPPRVRCYDLHDLTMKFERYLDAHVTDMVMLSDDYGKMALLLDDRTIGFHAPYGAHASLRIPSFGRGIAYEPTTCELLVAAKGNEVYRLNLEEGRFTEPWSFEPLAASATCISVSPTHPLAFVGCDDGLVRLWDNRTPDSMLKPFLTLDVKSATTGYGFADNPHSNPDEIRAIASDHTGLYMAAGTTGGVVALYDVRSSRPLHVMEHKHGKAIHTVKFHQHSGCVFSGDEKLIKIWRYRPSSDVASHHDSTSVGSLVVNVEGSSKLAHFIVAGDESDPTGSKSGLLLCATDEPKMESYYIPSIGLAPKWCSFLESITEELEERDITKGDGKQSDSFIQDGLESVFENYKFVSRDEIERLGINNLVGTPLLRGYMHGFFMDIQLYNRVRAVANPFEYEEYRKKKMKERIEQKRASRIAPKETSRTKVAVNLDLAARLQSKTEDTKSGRVARQLLSDERFGSLFTNPDFQVDEEDENFKLRNPSGVSAAKRRGNDLDSDEEDEEANSDERPGFYPVDNDPEGTVEYEAEGSGSDDESTEDGFAGAKVLGELYEEIRTPQMKRKKASKKQKRSAKSVMFESGDMESSTMDSVLIGLGNSSVDKSITKHQEQLKMSLAQRMKAAEEENNNVAETTALYVKGQGASRELSYVPRDSRKVDYVNESDKPLKRNPRDRRGIKELGFRTPFKNTR